MNREPWSGCYKVSVGCTYCYFYGPFSKRYGQYTIHKTVDFDKPTTITSEDKPKIGYSGCIRSAIASGRVVAACSASGVVKGFGLINMEALMGVANE
jgi:hypothetical protein